MIKLASVCTVEVFNSPDTFYTYCRDTKTGIWWTTDFDHCISDEDKSLTQQLEDAYQELKK